MPKQECESKTTERRKNRRLISDNQVVNWHAYGRRAQDRGETAGSYFRKEYCVPLWVNDLLVIIAAFGGFCVGRGWL